LTRVTNRFNIQHERQSSLSGPKNPQWRARAEPASIEDALIARLSERTGATPPKPICEGSVTKSGETARGGDLPGIATASREGGDKSRRQVQLLLQRDKSRQRRLIVTNLVLFYFASRIILRAQNVA
jgi:hypothetical protein